MEAIVLAGGKGTRLRSVVSDVPKPMAPIAGKPFLEFILEELATAGCNRTVLSVGYKWEVIRDHFGSHFGQMELVYAVENEPLGTGGAILLAAKECSEDNVLILNGDTYFHIDLEDFVRQHATRNNPLTIALKRMSNPDRYGTVDIEGSQIRKFNEKLEGLDSGLINGGIYAVRRSDLLGLDLPEKFSFEEKVLEQQVNQWEICGVESEEFFIDIGIPEDYHKADAYFRFPEITPDWTLFLDRDGVINERKVDDYVRSVEEFRILPGVKEAISRFSPLFRRVIVVTNQQGISKGLMTEEDLREIHDFMIREIEAEGGRIDAVYFCPALAADNDPCRKPNTGMASKAMSDFPDIDPSKCLMIGDSVSDMEFGRNAGMVNAFITEKPYKNEMKVTDIEAINLLQIVSYIQRSQTSS